MVRVYFEGFAVFAFSWEEPWLGDCFKRRFYVHPWSSENHLPILPSNNSQLDEDKRRTRSAWQIWPIKPTQNPNPTNKTNKKKHLSFFSAGISLLRTGYFFQWNFVDQKVKVDIYTPEYSQFRSKNHRIIPIDTFIFEGVSLQKKSRGMSFQWRVKDHHRRFFPLCFCRQTRAEVWTNKWCKQWRNLPKKSSFRIQVQELQVNLPRFLGDVLFGE